MNFMNESYQRTICSILFILGLALFILQIFILEWPDENLGLCCCLIEVACIIGGAIRLCQLSKDFKDGLFRFLGIFFKF